MQHDSHDHEFADSARVFSTTSAWQAPDRVTPSPLDLDRLAAMTASELAALYAEGTIPDTLTVLDGLPACRMLAVQGMRPGPVFQAIRRLAAWRSFPWMGKSFVAGSAVEGSGTNRVRALGQRLWFPFKTRIEPSVVDGKPCILLDYELLQNSRIIRMIRDELREVRPGLLLGPAMLDDKKHVPRVIVYFACDFGSRAQHD